MLPISKKNFDCIVEQINSDGLLDEQVKEQRRQTLHEQLMCRVSVELTRTDVSICSKKLMEAMKKCHEMGFFIEGKVLDKPDGALRNISKSRLKKKYREYTVNIPVLVNRPANFHFDFDIDQYYLCDDSPPSENIGNAVEKPSRKRKKKSKHSKSSPSKLLLLSSTAHDVENKEPLDIQNRRFRNKNIGTSGDDTNITSLFIPKEQQQQLNNMDVLPKEGTVTFENKLETVTTTTPTTLITTLLPLSNNSDQSYSNSTYSNLFASSRPATVPPLHYYEELLNIPVKSVNNLSEVNDSGGTSVVAEIANEQLFPEISSTDNVGEPKTDIGAIQDNTNDEQKEISNLVKSSLLEADIKIEPFMPNFEADQDDILSLSTASDISMQNGCIGGTSAKTRKAGEYKNIAKLGGDDINSSEGINVNEKLSSDDINADKDITENAVSNDNGQPLKKMFNFANTITTPVIESINITTEPLVKFHNTGSEYPNLIITRTTASSSSTIKRTACEITVSNTNELKNFNENCTAKHNPTQIAVNGDYKDPKTNIIHSKQQLAFCMTELFDITCVLYLHSVCPIDRDCPHKHNIQENSVLESKLLNLSKTELNEAYTFMYNHTMLFHHNFLAFCSLYTKQNNRQKLLKMISDCNRYMNGFVYLHPLFNGLVQTGLNKQNACELMLNLCDFESVGTINALVQIIREVDWEMFANYLKIFAEVPDFSYKCDMMEHMATTILNTGHWHLGQIFLSCMSTVNVFEKESVKRSKEIIQVLEIMIASQMVTGQ